MCLWFEVLLVKQEASLSPEEYERRAKAVAKASNAFWERASKDWTEEDWEELAREAQD